MGYLGQTVVIGGGGGRPDKNIAHATFTATVGVAVVIAEIPYHVTGVLIFILPILVFIAAFAAARGIVESESYRVLGGLICLVVYFIFLKRLETWFARRGTFRPVVRDIIEPAGS